MKIRHILAAGVAKKNRPKRRPAKGTCTAHFEFRAAHAAWHFDASSLKRVSLHPRENFRNKCFLQGGVRVFRSAPRWHERWKSCSSRRPAASSIEPCLVRQRAGEIGTERVSTTERERKNEQHQKVSGRIVHIQSKGRLRSPWPSIVAWAAFGGVARRRPIRAHRGVKKAADSSLALSVSRTCEHRKYFHASLLDPLAFCAARASHTKNSHSDAQTPTGQKNQTCTLGKMLLKFTHPELSVVWKF